MKTATSIPDRIFRAAERATKRQKVSRSRFYAQAVEAYLKTHHNTRQAKGVKEALDAIYGTENSELDSGMEAAACRLLAEEKW